MDVCAVVCESFRHPQPECTSDGKRGAQLLEEFGRARGDSECSLDEFLQRPLFVDIMSNEIASNRGVEANDLVYFKAGQRLRVKTVRLDVHVPLVCSLKR